MKKLAIFGVLAVFVAGILIFSAVDSQACCVYGDPPVIVSINADPGQLWPPNHKFVEVLVCVELTGTAPINWYISNVKTRLI